MKDDESLQREVEGTWLYPGQLRMVAGQADWFCIAAGDISGLWLMCG